jgi:outer membrane protein OmpA-like peptidoglycan-associated protein
MPARICKCTNYAGCQLAFGNADIEVEENFVCPECGKALREVPSVSVQTKPTDNMLLFGGISAAFLLIMIGGVFIFTQSSGHPGNESPSASVTSASTPTPTIASTPTATPNPAPTLDGGSVVITGGQDQQRRESETTKQEVLKRIDIFPNLKATERDRLYERVEQAREMFKVMVISFAVAQKSLSASAINKLRDAISTPRVHDLMQYPDIVFVILGFSDTQGSIEANLKLSADRADAVLDALRDRCGVMNIIHPLGMGSSEFFGEENKARNRVAEVWAVLP